MSAIFLPLAAAGGIYLAVRSLTNQTKKHRYHPRTTTSTSELSSTSSSSSNTDSDSQTKSKTDSITSTQSAPLKKSRRRRRYKKTRKISNIRGLFSLKNKSKREKREKKKEEKETRNLFVFYSFGDKNKDWDYKNLPLTWKMKRRVLSANRTSNFNNVDVFSGQKKYQDKMRNYLEKAFLQLKANDIVKDYRIRGINSPM